MMGDLGGGCLSQSTGGRGGRGTDHALCSQTVIRMQVGEVRRCKEKRERRTWMWRRKAAAGAVTHSPLPEIVRSCVRKLSWMCDSDRVV